MIFWQSETLNSVYIRTLTAAGYVPRVEHGNSWTYKMVEGVPEPPNPPRKVPETERRNQGHEAIIARQRRCRAEWEREMALRGDGWEPPHKRHANEGAAGLEEKRRGGREDTLPARRPLGGAVAVELWVFWPW